MIEFLNKLDTEGSKIVDWLPSWYAVLIGIPICILAFMLVLPTVPIYYYQKRKKNKSKVKMCTL